jgi:hypothetical protein
MYGQNPMIKDILKEQENLRSLHQNGNRKIITDTDKIRFLRHIGVIDILKTNFDLSENKISSILMDLGITSSSTQSTINRIKNKERNSISENLEYYLDKYNISY